MSIISPKERVYYYECSYGKFRLTYFIPHSELKKLPINAQIKEKLLIEYPDGIDLRVEETDYSDFKKTYGYRPPINPEVAQKIFFTMFSKTKNWEEFIGSGIIPAKDLEEKQLADIERSVKKDKNQSFSDFIRTPHEKKKPKIPEITKFRKEVMLKPDKKHLKSYHRIRKYQGEKQKTVYKFLKKIKPAGIDSNKTLREQRFSEIKWTKGDRIEDVFARIQNRGRVKKGA